MKLNETFFKNKKIAIVANRAPVTPVRKSNTSTFTIERSIGGLTAALEPIMERFNGMWFCTISKSSKVAKQSLEELPYKVIWHELTDFEHEKYYEGYSNKQLWPICHYFPSKCQFTEEDWHVYKSVNEKMGKLITENIDDDYMVWIHDYHFLLLPQILREKNKKLKIGFFLHIPFPNQELFRLLANREELLKGILGADLVGFHTLTYVKHFVDCVRVLLPDTCEEQHGSVISWDKRKIFVKGFPISIDFEQISNKALSKEVTASVKKLREAYNSEIIGISVDRLDYTKGTIERLLAIERFFEKYPQYIKKVTFIQISVPSRTNIEAYQELKRSVDETVGRINGKFSKEAWRPIFYIYRALPFEELVSYYSLSDFALVAPLRDGMNMVAKEYVASKVDGEGVLILSEFAGASEELASAMHINPYQTEHVANSIKQAIEMPLWEKTKRMNTLREIVRTNNVYNWVNNFFSSFHEAVEANKRTSPVR